MKKEGRYISASVMHSKTAIKINIKVSIFFLVICIFNNYADAKVIDRVVAFVDERAITLSEFEDYYKNTIRIKPEIKKEEVLNTMINRILLLREAKKLRIDAPSEDTIISEYIELKLRTFIKITEEDMKEFYEKNRIEFSGVDFEDVRDKIEFYLTELEVNVKLKKHLEDLKSQSYIKIQMNQNIEK